MKRLFSLLSVFLVALSLSAQPEIIPPGYEKTYLSEKQRAQEALQTPGVDVVIDPIENITQAVSFYEAATQVWHQEYLKAQAHDQLFITKKDQLRTVYVVIHDTGQWDHNDLTYVTRFDLGQSFTGEPMPDLQSHSTHVAGLVAARNDNFQTGTADILGELGKLFLFSHKCLTNSGTGSFAGITNSVKAAVDKGIDLHEAGAILIHVMSLGGGGYSKELEAEFKRGIEAGQIFIVAAGNNGTSKISHPADIPWALSIGALQLNSNGTVSKASYSNFGELLFAVAPGSFILSTLPGQGYGKKSGTSMATPIFAGIMAKIAAYYPEATNNQLINFLIDNLTDLPPSGRDDQTGYGSPILTNLLKAAKPPTDYPDDRDDVVDEPDNPDEPGFDRREKRKLFITLPNDVEQYSVIWSKAGFKNFVELDFQITVEWETDLTTEDATPLLKESVDQYFARRGYLLKPDHGSDDATYYVGYFFDMMMKRVSEEFDDLEMHTVYSTDHTGISQIVYDRDFWDRTGDAFSRLSVDFPRTMQFTPGQYQAILNK
jgi:hypothetical protein